MATRTAAAKADPSPPPPDEAAPESPADDKPVTHGELASAIDGIKSFIADKLGGGEAPPESAPAPTPETPAKPLGPRAEEDLMETKILAGVKELLADERKAGQAPPEKVGGSTEPEQPPKGGGAKERLEKIMGWRD